MEAQQQEEDRREQESHEGSSPVLADQIPKQWAVGTVTYVLNQLVECVDELRSLTTLSHIAL